MTIICTFTIHHVLQCSHQVMEVCLLRCIPLTSMYDKQYLICMLTVQCLQRVFCWVAWFSDHCMWWILLLLLSLWLVCLPCTMCCSIAVGLWRSSCWVTFCTSTCDQYYFSLILCFVQCDAAVFMEVFQLHSMPLWSLRAINTTIICLFTHTPCYRTAVSLWRCFCCVPGLSPLHRISFSICYISRVPDQNGISRLYNMLEI